MQLKLLMEARAKKTYMLIRDRNRQEREEKGYEIPVTNQNWPIIIDSGGRET